MAGYNEVHTRDLTVFLMSADGRSVATRALRKLCRTASHATGHYVALTFLPARRLCRNTELTHICHPEHSEESCIFSRTRRKDFSASPRNDNCDTVIYVPLGTTRRMKMIASQRQRPMTSGRSDCSASSLHTVGPEYSKGTRSVAPLGGKHV